MTILKENNSIRKLLNVTQWHEKNITGENTTVIILDSSKGKSLPFMNLYYTDVFGNAIESGHPINVAQTLHEISPSTKILYFDNTRNKDAVFEWIKAHQNEIDIINVSLAGLNGMPTDDYLRYEALSPIMVCASGNDYYTDHISYPAQYPFTIAIGATNRVGTSVDSYSNKGSMIIATCPSHTYIRNSEGMIWSPSGTSFASPVAVGLLAIYIDWRKKNRLSKLTPEETMQFVKNNCVDIEDVGRDNKSGYGLFVLPNLEELEKTLLKEKPIVINPPILTPIPEVKKYWRIQCGSFSVKNNALTEQIRLKILGLETYLICINNLWKIQLGCYSIESNGRKESKRINDMGINNFVVYY